jgi:hypothetical protein
MGLCRSALGDSFAAMKTLIALPDASAKGNEVTREPFRLLISEVKE